MEETIKLQVNDINTSQYVKIHLEQDFDTLNILSLNLTSDKVYTRVTSDYGVLVGKVTLKNGIGVQNAKVSVFIPITTNDLQRNEIIQYYPFQTVNDTFPNGLRYNLLPRVRNIKNPSHKAVGTLPHITDFSNFNIFEEIYDKYYKLSAITNEAGDYMIFGIPTGVYQIVMDFDLFDTSSFEITANDLVDQLSLNKNITDIKSFLSLNISGNTIDDTSNIPGFIYKGNGEYDVEVNIDIDKMPNIFHDVKQVNIQSFWGDDNSNVGICQCDFNIDFKYTPTAVFFGFIGSSPETIAYDANGVVFNQNIQPTRLLQEEVYSVVGKSDDGRNTGSYYPVQDLEIVVYKMDDTNTIGTRKRIGVYKTVSCSGYFKITLPMYTDYYTLNEFGNMVPTNNTKIGIPTKGSYCFEMYETNQINYGIRRPWGGGVHSILSGVRIPANNDGDINFGGWLGTSWGSFEYDILNNRRKFYTIKTSYKNHGSNIAMSGNLIPYIPIIDTNKSSETFWQFPLNDDKITNENIVIGSCFLPRINRQFNRDLTNIHPNFWITNDVLINPNVLAPDDTTRPKFGIYQIVYGIGSDLDITKGGKNIGPVFEELFNSDAFTNNGLNSYGTLDTINFGDNSITVYRGTAYSRDLAKSKLSNANEFNVHKPYTQAISDQVTVGLFVNSVNYLTSLTCMEIEIYDITNELPNLVKDKVYSSYQKGVDNKYNGKYYYFGMWNGSNSLIDIEKSYF
jgi:hypothetical protein